MILYKYLSLKSFFEVWKSSSLGFSCLEDFNDPFECTNFGFKEHEELKASMDTQINAYRNNLSRKYAVLSLTRQPLNPIMWSHYADNHKGVAVGIDVEGAKLNCKKKFIIPSQYGEVVYSNTKLKDVTLSDAEELMTIDNIRNFDSSTYDLLKRAFLYKSLQWAHEEEVRVVTSICESLDGYHTGEESSNNWRKIRLNGNRPLFCWSMPRESIREVYIGCNVYRNLSRDESVSDSELSKLKLELTEKAIKVMHTKVALNSWNLTSYEDHNLG